MVDPVRVQLRRRRGRPQRAADLAHGLAHDLGGRLPLGRGGPAAGVLRAVPIPGDGARRRLPRPRLHHLRDLLGARPPADVLPHRDLGRAEPPLCGAEVPDLHPRRLRDHAPLDLLPVLVLQRLGERGGLRHERTDVGHDGVPPRRPPPCDRFKHRLHDPGRPDPDLRGIPVRLHRQAAVRAVPHMASRCARRGADRRVRPPGRGAAEDGRLRHLPDQPGHAPGCGPQPLVGPRDPRHRLDDLRGLRVPRPDRSQTTDRVQLGRPHGLRAPRRREHDGDRRAGRNLPAVQPRDHHRDPVHARRQREA